MKYKLDKCNLRKTKDIICAVRLRPTYHMFKCTFTEINILNNEHLKFVAKKTKTNVSHIFHIIMIKVLNAKDF